MISELSGQHRLVIQRCPVLEGRNPAGILSDQAEKNTFPKESLVTDKSLVYPVGQKSGPPGLGLDTSPKTTCLNSLSLSLRLSVASEKPLEGGSWSTLQLVVMSLVPCLLLGVGMAAGVVVMHSHRCAYTAHKQDPEEHLDDQMLMSADKCLKDLIGDMSTSGSGSGRLLGGQANGLDTTSVPNSCFCVPQVCLCWCSGPSLAPLSCRRASGRAGSGRCGGESGEGRTWQ